MPREIMDCLMRLRTRPLVANESANILQTICHHRAVFYNILDADILHKTRVERTGYH